MGDPNRRDTFLAGSAPWDLDPNYDVPRYRDGWRLPQGYFSPDGMARNPAYGSGYVVTRPAGYAPYQSVVQPDGRYAYNPSQDQYPRTVGQERLSGRTTLHPASRQVESIVNRSNHYVHRPGEVVTMGIDYDQMRTAPIRQPQQPMMDQYGRPVVQGPARGSMGPPPLPHMYGGNRGGQR